MIQILHRTYMELNTEHTRNLYDHLWLRKSYLFRVSLVLLVFCVGSVLLPRAVEAGEATIKIDPPQGTFYVGSSFDVSVILDTGGETINAVETELRFPPNILQVTSPTAARSFVAIWTSPPSYSNQDGFVRFQGGVPSSGLKTSQGVLSTISFRATQPGSVVLEFRDSRVLLADGSGTNIFSSALGARYTILIPPPQGPIVSSFTHPEFTKWYRDRTAAFNWIKDKGVTEFSWSLDQNPNGIPDTEGDGERTAVSYDNLEDGLWYFHIRAKKQDVWGGVTTFPVKIDTAPPAQFLVELEPKDKVTVKTRTSVIFRTTDALSGLDRYEVNIVNVSGPGQTRGSTFFVEAESPYVLSDLPQGVYNIVVRAYDQAENFQESSAALEVREPAFALFLTQGFDLGFRVVRWALVILPLLGVMFVLGFLVLRFWRRHREVRKVKDTGKGIGKLQERFEKEIEGLQNRVVEDRALRERFGGQLKKLSDLNKTFSKTGGKDTRKGIWGRGLKMLIILFFLAGSALAGDSSSISDDLLPAPKILTHQLEIASNQLLYVTGIAPPESLVSLYISGENQGIIQTQAYADENGEWEYLHNLYLQPGFYQMWVEAESPTGVKTRPSEPIGFRATSRLVGEEGTFWGPELILGTVVAMLVIVNVGLLGFLIYFWHRSTAMRRTLRKEVQEVHEALQLGFTLIKHEIKEDRMLLEKGLKRNKAALAKERSTRESLLKNIAHIERSIKKEVSDISKVL